MCEEGRGRERGKDEVEGETELRDINIRWDTLYACSLNICSQIRLCTSFC